MPSFGNLFRLASSSTTLVFNEFVFIAEASEDQEDEDYTASQRKISKRFYLMRPQLAYCLYLAGSYLGA